MCASASHCAVRYFFQASCEARRFASTLCSCDFNAGTCSVAIRALMALVSLLYSAISCASALLASSSQQLVRSISVVAFWHGSGGGAGLVSLPVCAAARPVVKIARTAKHCLNLDAPFRWLLLRFIASPLEFRQGITTPQVNERARILCVENRMRKYMPLDFSYSQQCQCVIEIALLRCPSCLFCSVASRSPSASPSSAHRS